MASLKVGCNSLRGKRSIECGEVEPILFLWISWGSCDSATSLYDHFPRLSTFLLSHWWPIIPFELQVKRWYFRLGRWFFPPLLNLRGRQKDIVSTSKYSPLVFHRFPVPYECRKYQTYSINARMSCLACTARRGDILLSYTCKNLPGPNIELKTE